MPKDIEESLSDDATFAGSSKRRAVDASLGDERTLGDGLVGQDTVIDDMEVVDLALRYRIEGTLGQGGMGEVLLAVDTRLDRKVAIKRILGDASRSQTAVSRFLTEAKSIAALNHPNIVQIYDYGRAKDGPFLIMEYVDGSSLLDRCRDGALPLEEAIDLACQLCDGLAKAHDLGIIHRDIKPANVLLTKDGTPKLTDFGLAKAQANDHGQTMTGAVLGTPDFMPPEQRKDASLVDARSDLWSLAATVYQMVTGKSPKIIRFKDVPESLQEVLGKALEDGKEDRYQTAREFRDALKVSLRDTGPVAASLSDGQCPSCGMKNDSSRKFCRGCGGSLETPCLSCEKPIPIWEEICGQCGTKQGSLLEGRRVAMASRQAEAESLLKEFNFDESQRIVTALRDEPDPRLKHLTVWSQKILSEIEQGRVEQRARAARLLVEALRHEQAFDYPSGIHALEQVPDILRNQPLPGQQSSVTAVLSRLSIKQVECERLERLVKARLAGRELGSLLPEVEKLLVLQPHRTDVQKLKSQLDERHAKLVALHDAAVVRGRELVSKHDYQSAVSTLSAIDSSVATPESKSLRAQAAGLVAQVEQLLATIKKAVAEKRYDGLLTEVDSLLQLTPEHTEMEKLRQSLVGREEKIAADIALIQNQAEGLWQACRFADATTALGRIPEARRSSAVATRFDACEEMGFARSTAMEALVSAGASGRFSSGLEQSQHYQSLLADHALEDQQFAEALRRCELAHAEQAAAAEADTKRQRMTFRIVMSAGLVATIAVVLVTGLWSRSSYRARLLERAIADSRWDDVLSLDPKSTAAHIGRALSKLSGATPAISGAFDDLAKAEAINASADGLANARAQALALRSIGHARGNRLTEAESDLQEAKRLGLPDAALAPVRQSLAQGWLGSAAAAAVAQSESGINTACTAAEKYGATADEVNPLRAQSQLVVAARYMTKGDEDKAVAAFRSAVVLSPAIASKALSAPAAASLKQAVMSGIKQQFDEALSREDWDGSAARWQEINDLDAEAGLAYAQRFLELSPAVLGRLPPLRNSIGMEMKLIPAGHFQMGENGSAVAVTLTRPFWLGKTEVTQGQWQKVMGIRPGDRAVGKSDSDLPALNVSWDDVTEFCKMLTQRERRNGKLAANESYRLPTEAEWEYACRAGTTTTFSFGDDESQLGDFGWFGGDSGGAVHAVGTRQANPWGLHDMHGNVWEWCSDWYGEKRAGGADPIGPEGGSHRVLRGGSWRSIPVLCRSAYRSINLPSSRIDDLGFRVARSQSVQ